MKIGFIGLGQMGTGIARNLIGAEHEVTVYNRTRSHAEPFAGEGARVADTPADAATDAEIIMTMLADDAAVEHVVFGENGAIKALPKGAVHVSLSTISVALSARLSEVHQT